MYPLLKFFSRKKSTEVQRSTNTRKPIEIHPRKRLMSSDHGKKLYTTEMPLICGISYKYESCLFVGSQSEVIMRYDTYEEAKNGHRFITKRLNLTFIEETVI